MVTQVSYPGEYTLPSLPPPWLLPNPVAKHVRQHQPQPESRVGSFDLKILNLNVWGLKLADRKNERMPAIAKMLLHSDYDAVLVQEAWYNVDYHLLAATFPYVTNYGTPGSVFIYISSPMKTCDYSNVSTLTLFRLHIAVGTLLPLRQPILPKDTKHADVLHPTLCRPMPRSHDFEQVFFPIAFAGPKKN